MLMTEATSSTSDVALAARIGKMPHTMRQVTSENAKEAKLEMFETRFGAIELDTSNPLVFEHGLLGMPDSRLFALTDFPNPKLGNFKLLQSLEDKTLSFIILPVMMDNGIIARDDLEKAAADTGIELKDMTTFLIVSVHRTPSETKLSVNARAPLLIDASNRSAMQYVFQHSRYKVQQFLNG